MYKPNKSVSIIFTVLIMFFILLARRQCSSGHLTVYHPILVVNYFIKNTSVKMYYSRYLPDICGRKLANHPKETNLLGSPQD